MGRGQVPYDEDTISWGGLGLGDFMLDAMRMRRVWPANPGRALHPYLEAMTIVQRSRSFIIGAGEVSWRLAIF